MDWSNPAGAAVQGGFGIISSALNYHFNKKLAEQQNQYNLEMWNLQNEYNSPQAQMKRFEEAGLNPMLIYNQGTSGNASAAPQMVTPQAPDVSKDMRDLAQAFNIEGLRTAIANRKKAEADARIAGASADDAESTNYALRRLYWNYHFDPASGTFVHDGGISSRDGYNLESKDVLPRMQMYGEGKLMKLLSDNFRTNALIMPRSSLIGSQSLLNAARNAYLAPQIRAAEFNATPWRLKTNFWLGNVKTGVQAVAPLIPLIP